jgi:8-oxo-dGTP pyrophosphatase MutT (NUDIX family)
MKYVSAGALFFDEQGNLLVVKPTYKEGWEIPGGIVEPDESPKQACLREIREELGLEMAPGPLLVVDYLPRKGAQPESLQMLFLGGILTPSMIRDIRLPPDELSEYRFVPPDAVPLLLGRSLALRVAGGLRAIAEKQAIMLHDGEEA